MSAQAAEPLTAEIKPLALRPRTGAPETTDVTLHWSGSGLLEGALELTFSPSDKSAPQYRSHDLVLTGAAQTFRLLVPANLQDGRISREVRAQFVTKADTLDLGNFDFGTPTGPERNFTICVSRPRLRGAPQDFALWQSLRIERFQPGTKGSNSLGAATMPVHVETEEMSANALGYAPYDIVLLEGEGFTLLRERQLAALSRWVLAGGSVCVATDAPLDPLHRRFLEDLFAADVRKPSAAFDTEGRLEMKEEGGTIRVRPGFGRLVVAAPGPQSSIEAEAVEWTQAVLFLWKFRASQVDSILNLGDGVWRWPTYQPGSRRRDELHSQLAGILAPKQVRILPYPIVLLVLAAFVIVIGPLDWIVLGRLRMRRLTWVTFPLAAVAFTVLTVFLAERYMGRNNYRSSLTITDLGHDGRVLRETRFEMLFPARNQEVTTDVRNGLCVPMDISQGYYGNRQESAVATRYEGLFPTGYKVRQSLRQWTPQMNRLTSLDGVEDTSGVPWAKLDPRELNAANVRQRVGSDVAKELYVVRGVEFLGLEKGTLSGVVESLLQPTDLRWSGIFTAVGPNGAANFEDLAFIPQTEFNATIVVRNEGESFHIYRHLYAP